MVLKLENNVPDFNGFRLLLLVSNLHDYQLAYFINGASGLKLKRYNDIPFASKTNKVRYFSWYYYEDTDKKTVYYFVENRHGHDYLFPCLKKIDFLLFIKNSVSENSVKNLASKLREIRGITAVFGHEISVLKDAGYFLDEMELHELEQIIIPSKKVWKKQ